MKFTCDAPAGAAAAKRIALAAALLAALAPVAAQAHDFWMDFGADWRAEPGETLAMRFVVGHAGDREDWNFRRERVVHFRQVGPDGSADLSGALVDRTPERPAGARVALATPGSQLLAFETNEVVSELPAEKFDAYARAEGLSLVIAARKARGRQGPGREVYSRRAKAIVQIGAAATDTVSAPVGHTLEIVPERNPLGLRKGEALPVRVLWRGEPLAGASVHLESLSVGLVPETTKITDLEGRAVFAFPKNGAWKIDAVWSEPIDDPKAEFRTVFASLTFAY